MATTEGELVFPSLRILSDRSSAMTTTQLMAALRDVVDLDDDDRKPLAGRADDHFSQKVRNLKSHNTLSKLGYADFKNGKFKITDKGRSALKNFGNDFEYLYRQGFDKENLSNSIKSNPENIVIEEGEIFILSQKSRIRSRNLRQHAIAHFLKTDGALKCYGCDFDPTALYGEGFESLIEIHHTKPISLLPNDGEAKSLAEALNTVVPLCPRCHRTVHLRPGVMMTLDELRTLLGTEKV